MTNLNALALFLLSLGSIIPSSAASLHVNVLPEPDINQRLRAGMVSLKERQGAIQNLFNAVGCQVEKQKIDRKNSNIICSLSGETNATIVVGAHYDFIDVGKGIVDDWSGTALLPSLYAALKDEPRRHTIKFVAFASEEKGLIGSNEYVKGMSKEELTNVKAFVNAECLGLGPPNVWVHRSTSLLVSRLAEVAKAVNIPLHGVDVDEVGDDDTHPFLSKKIPVVSIHSLTQQTIEIIHTGRDNIDAIKHDEYYTSYKLLAFYLAYLDQALSQTSK